MNECSGAVRQISSEFFGHDSTRDISFESFFGDKKAQANLSVREKEFLFNFFLDIYFFNPYTLETRSGENGFRRERKFEIERENGTMKCATKKAAAKKKPAAKKKGK